MLAAAAAVVLLPILTLSSLNMKRPNNCRSCSYTQSVSREASSNVLMTDFSKGRTFACECVRKKEGERGRERDVRRVRLLHNAAGEVRACEVRLLQW